MSDLQPVKTPTVSADGVLLSPLLMVLQEKGGHFGPIVEQTVFRPNNIHLKASKSGKMSTKLVREWEEEVLFPGLGKQVTFITEFPLKKHPPMSSESESARTLVIRSKNPYSDACWSGPFRFPTYVRASSKGGRWVHPCSAPMSGFASDSRAESLFIGSG